MTPGLRPLEEEHALEANLLGRRERFLAPLKAEGMQEPECTEASLVDEAAESFATVEYYDNISGKALDPAGPGSSCKGTPHHWRNGGLGGGPQTR